MVSTQNAIARGRLVTTNMAEVQLTRASRAYDGFVRYLLLLIAVAAWAGADPKPKAEDYEVHGRAGAVTIGAEYMVTSVGGEGQMFVLDDYLVVEVGLFPRKGD